MRSLFASITCVVSLGLAAGSPEEPAPRVVDAAHFGAIANDGSDDAPGIQRALDALPREGGTVHLGRGQYLLSSSAGTVGAYPDGSPVASALIIDSNEVVLEGEGPTTVLELERGSKMRVISIVGSDVLVQDVTVDGNKAERDGSQPWPSGDVVNALVHGRDSNNVTIRRCEVRNGIEDGIGFWRSRGAVVEDCFIHGNGTEAAGGAGIALSGGVDSVARRNIVRGNTAAGIWSAFGSVGTEIRENVVVGNRKAGVSLNGSNFVVEDNVVKRNGVNGAPAVNLYGVEGAVLEDNLVSSNYSTGISVGPDGTLPSRDVWLTNNVCRSIPAGRQAVGIWVRSPAMKITVTGNTCANNGNSLGDQIRVDPEAEVVSDWLSDNVVSFGAASGSSDAKPAYVAVGVVIMLAVVAVGAWVMAGLRR